MIRIPKIKKNMKKPNVYHIINRFKTGYNLLQKKQERVQPVPSVIGLKGIYLEGAQVEKKKKEHPKIDEGIEISAEFRPFKIPLKLTEEEREELSSVNIYYPLNPSKPKQGEKVFAYANIKWNPELNELVYNVLEPKITPGDEELIKKIIKILEERLDIDFSKLGEIKGKEILRREIEKELSKEGITTEPKRSVIIYYIERDIIGFGKIDALMRDPNIEDISVDGINVPIYIYHRNPKFASMRTNLFFRTKEELDDFVIRLAQKCNKTISVAEPLMDASLPDGSRVQATLGTDIAMKGSNFTIRKFTDKPLTPVHMLKYKTLNSLQLAYLWLAIENRKTVLISGGTATGKTSLLNALSLFIKPNLKIVSIEDTAELRLPHIHWIPQVARTPLSLKHRKGEVTLFDLLRSSLRQRPDYIIVGEVRCKEAFVMFQQIATGHAALSTIHAASIPQLIDRLITPPISLPPSLIENIDIIIFLVLTKLRESYVRRADSILEVLGVENNKPVTKEVFKWKPATDTFETTKKSTVLKNIAERLGMTEDTVKQELANRKKILEWMYNEGIYDYKDVARVINSYYTNPETVLNMIAS